MTTGWDTYMNELGEMKPGVSTFTCMVGDKVRVCHSKFDSGSFRIVYSKLGVIEEDSANPGCIVYNHRKSGKQIIEFTSDNPGGTKSYLVMNTVDVHDHASVPMGGPAYATYFTENWGQTK